MEGRRELLTRMIVTNRFSVILDQECVSVNLLQDTSIYLLDVEEASQSVWYVCSLVNILNQDILSLIQLWMDYMLLAMTLFSLDMLL